MFEPEIKVKVRRGVFLNDERKLSG